MRRATHKDKIRALNDTFRKTFIGGRVMLTKRVNALGKETQANVFSAVQSFSKFHKPNDPRHEHDFGACTIDGQRYIWKIDYYDLAMNEHTVDPTNAEATIRILTIMCADEY